MIYSPGQNFHRVYEPCLVGWKNGKPRFINRTFANFTELWTVDLKTFQEHLDVWYQKRDNTHQYIHPTQKPVQLAERALKRSSEENDIVLDAFGGSGSTMMACEQLNRCARLIELDPKYVDATIGRYLKFTESTHVIKNGKKIAW
jgi:DNA modification methylase